MQISIIQPSRNNLKYLKWSYDSIRKNQGNHDVQICVADDFSNDGTWEWCEEMMQKDSNFNAIRNEGPTRLGHTILYDRLVNEVAKYDYCMIYHADMYLAPGALDSVSSYLAKGRIVSLTRVEPPLHPDGPEKVLKDFGTEPEHFNERNFLSWLELEYKPKHSKDTTEGIFAPWAFYKKDFQDIGGHDELYAPQSKEDCVVGETPILVEINGVKDYITIKELWQKYEQFSKVRDDGKKYINISDTEDSVRVLSAKKDGVLTFSNLEVLLKTNVDSSNIITLSLPHGTVSITKDHSLIDSDLNAIKIDEVEDLKTLWKPLNFDDVIITESVDTDRCKLFLDEINDYINNPQDIYEISEYDTLDRYVEVFDLQVQDTHTFVGGLVGLHNSDIFNRFQLNGIRFIQTWKGLVYHMTCRGSRFNPTLTEIGKNSNEWEIQNIKSLRNFIRKWGSPVKHDQFLKPIIPPKYRIYIKLLYCDSLELINFLELFCDTLYVNEKLIEEYIKLEQPNTRYNLKDRVKPLSEFSEQKGVTILIDANNFGNKDAENIQNLPLILNDSGEIGEFTLGGLTIRINDLTTYEKDLINN